MSGHNIIQRILSRRLNLTDHPAVGGPPLPCVDSGGLQVIIRGRPNPRWFSGHRLYDLFLTGPEDRLAALARRRTKDAPQKDGTIWLGTIPGTDFSQDFVKLFTEELKSDGIYLPFVTVSQRIYDDIERHKQKQPPHPPLGIERLPGR